MTKNAEDDPKAAARYIMTERFLERAVVWLGIGAFVLALIGIFYLTHPAGDLAAKMELLWRGMVIYGGLLGFVTVVWRGLITTRQADQQREQLSIIAGQLAQSERNALSELLDKGVTLLRTDDHIKKEAGIRILCEVALTDSEKFANVAGNILLRFRDEVPAATHPTLNAFVNMALDQIRQRHKSKQATS